MRSSRIHNVSGSTFAAPTAVSSWKAKIRAHPSSLCLTASEIGLENYIVADAIITATSVAWPTHAPRECAHGKCSFV